MNHDKKRAWLILLVLLCSAAIFASACASKSGGGDSATASPTATVLDYCQVLWSSPGTNAGHFDLYVVDAPLASWTTGDHNFDLTVGMEITALFYDEFDFSVTPHQYLSRAIATSGTYSVTAPGGTTAGQSIAFIDSSAQTFFAIDGSGNLGAQVGMGGTGNFGVGSPAGVFSDPTMPNSPTPGAGTINITYNSVPESIGTFNYALCYDASAPAFAPMRPIDRIDAALSQIHRAPGR